MLTQIIITSMTAVFSLPQLPYETNALEPVISKETIDRSEERRVGKECRLRRSPNH